MSNQSRTCVKLTDYVHELLFSFAGRSYPDSYFTVYALDDGTHETRLCTYPVDPEGKHLTDYAEEMISSLHGRSLLGFAMFLSQENDQGLFHWWCLSTDNQVNMDAARFVPFTNDDGIFDYMPLTANPRKPEDKDSMMPLLEGTNLVWSLALARGAADIEVGETISEAVQA